MHRAMVLRAGDHAATEDTRSIEPEMTDMATATQARIMSMILGPNQAQ